MEVPPMDKLEHPLLVLRGLVDIFYLGLSFFPNSPFFPPFSYVFLSYQMVPCPKCDRTFAAKSHLERHMPVHTQAGVWVHFSFWFRTMVKPYSCVVCGWRFHLLHNMQRHLATHKTQEKVPYTDNTNNFPPLSSLTPRFGCHNGFQHIYIFRESPRDPKKRKRQRKRSLRKPKSNVITSSSISMSNAMPMKLLSMVQLRSSHATIVTIIS